MTQEESVFKRAGRWLPNSAVAWGARSYFNHHYKSIGVMTRLEIDAENKKASLELDLKGETKPLQIKIGAYELTTSGGKDYLEIKDIEASREWINAIVKEIAKNGKLKFEVPALVKAVL